MNDGKKEFGKRLAEIRKARNLNQEEFKNLIGVPTVQMISSWENGHSFPSATYLIIIAKKLDISVDYLLLGKEDIHKKPTIKTYKDAAHFMTELVRCGLFDIENFQYQADKYGVSLTSKDKTISDFKRELTILLNAAKTLRPELFNQAILDLFDKYDIPLKQ